jgi:hypothetical protein
VQPEFQLLKFLRRIGERLPHRFEFLKYSTRSKPLTPPNSVHQRHDGRLPIVVWFDLKGVSVVLA